MSLRFFYLCAVLLVAGIVTNSFAEGKYQRYSHKSGIIEFQIEGAYKGEATLYWDDYGMKEALYTNKEMKKGFIIIDKDRSLDLVLGEYNYDIDLDPIMRSGTKKKNGYDVTFGLAGAEAIAEINAAIYKALGGKLVGQSEVCGQTCDDWELKIPLKSKYSIWEGIKLYSENTVPPKIKFTRKCTSIKLDCDIPADKFEIPSDIEITLKD